MTLAVLLGNQPIKIVECQGLTEGVLLAGERTIAQIAHLRSMGNFPNPFSESTEVQFELSQPGTITMEVFDVLGRRIESLSLSYASAGVRSYVVSFSRSSSTEG